jgi:hypothetical protein
MKKGNVTSKPKTGTVRVAGKPVSVVRQTHELRSSEAIQVFETELAGSTSDLGRFLLHYYCCDVLAHLIQGRWNSLGQAESLSPGPNQTLKISQVRAALNRLSGEWKMSDLDSIFHAKKLKHSARILRNAIVHKLDKATVSLAHSKIGAKRIESMRQFIDATEKFIDTGGQFAKK